MMAEVLMKFAPPLTDDTGITFTVQVCGRVGEDRLWEGWIEFAPQDGGTPLRTPRETKQSDRNDIEYWASGLTVAYLEGALARARRSSTPGPPVGSTDAVPEHDRPAPPAAPSNAPLPDASARIPTPSNAVLDPFTVYAQGEDVLWKELNALDGGHLRNIIRSYALGKELELDLVAADRRTLADAIVAAVRDRAG